MDPKLMSDFEELEGLADNNKEEELVNDEDEDEANFKPTSATALSSADIYHEVSLVSISVN
jgi:hypothetical protein